MPLNFLLISFGTHGNLAPLLTGARQLRARGHRVRVMAEPEMRPEVERAGFGFAAWTRAPADTDGMPWTTYEDWLERVIFGPAEAYAADTLEEIARAPTDAVLILDLLFGCALAARAAGVPYAVFSPHVSIRPLKGMPLTTSGRPPPRTAAERAETDRMAAWMEQTMDRFLPGFNRVGAVFGLPPMPSTFDVIDRADRVLLAIGRSFDFQAESLPLNFRYVGPLLDEPGWASGWTPPWTWPDVPRALISCSSGAQRQQPVFERMVGSFAGMAAEAVATSGPAVDMAQIRPPANVHLLPAAPHDAVMREVSVVVTQGGHGTVSRALLHGLPLLVVPVGRDQHDNAVRVEAHGAGLRLSAAASEAEIAAAVNRLLTEPGFRAAATTLGEALRAEIEARGLVREMEAIAVSPTLPPERLN